MKRMELDGTDEAKKPMWYNENLGFNQIDDYLRRTTAAGITQTKDKVYVDLVQFVMEAKFKRYSKKGPSAANARSKNRMESFSRMVQDFDELNEKLAERGERKIIIDVSHSLRAIPCYVDFDFKQDRALGTGLSNSIGAGDRVKRKRFGFRFDPNGRKSSLRLVTNARDDTDEVVYVESSASYGSAESSMWNLLPSSFQQTSTLCNTRPLLPQKRSKRFGNSRSSIPRSDIPISTMRYGYQHHRNEDTTDNEDDSGDDADTESEDDE